VASGTPRDIDARALVRAMIGRDVAPGPATLPDHGATRLSARDVRARGLRIDHLEAARGEVLGVTGQRGSGATRLLDAMIGLSGSASVDIDGAALDALAPRPCIASGMLLLSGDRRRSLVPSMSVAHNATLSALLRFSRHGFMQHHAERREVDALAKQLSIASIDAPVEHLSGGNQQKVAWVRALLAEPRVLLLDEPTRGIDVGAKEEIYALVSNLARRGVTLVVSSSESEELMRMCTRVIVLADGGVVATLHGDTLTREQIVSAAMHGGAS
jgi:ribose transport system ATP-binding protein